MSRRPPGRATRQILSGTQLSPSRETIGGRLMTGETFSLVYAYFVLLAVLIIVSAVVWAIWGAGPASVVLLLLAFGLIASWLVL
jgi:hypothetical protein